MYSLNIAGILQHMNCSRKKGISGRDCTSKILNEIKIILNIIVNNTDMFRLINYQTITGDLFFKILVKIVFPVFYLYKHVSKYGHSNPD